jgi:hypothetical protein
MLKQGLSRRSDDVKTGILATDRVKLPDDKYIPPVAAGARIGLEEVNSLSQVAVPGGTRYWWYRRVQLFNNRYANTRQY